MNNTISKFTYIKKEERETQIEAFICLLFGNRERKTSDIITEQQMIREIANGIHDDFTIVTEEYHIDKTFRDSYYMYFSNQHFQVERYCKRLVFLKGRYSWKNFLGGLTQEKKEDMEESVVGSCVVKPTSEGQIGRTLLNPKYFMAKNSNGAYVRVSKYTINLYGIPLTITAFPYQMQDRETMRCSEVTLLNLMDYYSNTYKDYKEIVPSDIIKSEQKHSHERVLPSRGMTYHVLTKVLSDFGFAPRLYNVKAMRNSQMSGISQRDEIKRLLHYYIESGIPVAVNVEPDCGRGIGHSLICIGHSDEKSYEKAKSIKKIKGLNGKYSIINSADLYENYVVIDDNQFPYEIRNFDKMSIYPEMSVTNIAVPLYKRMFLEAADAYDIALMIIESERWGVFKWAKGYLGNEKDIIIRLFLASSRSFKRERVENFSKSSIELQAYYANVRMPRFVWVCEMYTEEGYEDKKAFGEVVLDGTSASKKGIKNVILLNYPEGLYARNPDQSEGDIDENKYKVSNWCGIDAYSRNLQNI